MTKLSFEAAIADVAVAFSRSELWLYLGIEDIRARYRRTTLGPIWLSVTMAVSVLGLGLLYGVLFKGRLGSFFPWLIAGMLAWQFITGPVINGCTVFINHGTLINTIRTPLTMHVYRAMVGELLVFLHNLPVFLIAAVILGTPFTSWTLLVIPAVAVYLLNGFWAALALGILAARFRDLPQMVASLLGLAFFFTPIIWKPEMLGPHAIYADFNPFTHFLEIVRNPLLGAPPRPLSVTVVAAITVLGWLGAMLLLARYRRSVPLWVS